MCDGIKKKVALFCHAAYQPQQIFPFAFLCLLEFTVVWNRTQGLTLFQIPSLLQQLKILQASGDAGSRA